MQTRCAGDVRSFKCNRLVQIVAARLLSWLVRPLAPGSAVGKRSSWFEEPCRKGLVRADNGGPLILCIDGMVGGGRLRAPMGQEMEGIGKAWEGARRGQEKDSTGQLR